MFECWIINKHIALIIIYLIDLQYVLDTLFYIRSRFKIFVSLKKISFFFCKTKNNISERTKHFTYLGERVEIIFFSPKKKILRYFSSIISCRVKIVLRIWNLFCICCMCVCVCLRFLELQKFFASIIHVRHPPQRQLSPMKRDWGGPVLRQQ